MKDKKIKTYVVDVKGVCISEDEWDNTTIHITRGNDWCELEFDKSDIVETLEEQCTLKTNPKSQL